MGWAAAAVWMVLGCGGLDVPSGPEGSAPGDGVDGTAERAKTAEAGDPAPSGPPALVGPVPDGDGCAIRPLTGGEVLARFAAPCSQWTIARSPTDPGDVVVTMRSPDGWLAARNGVALPAAPAGKLEAVGFDPAGRLVMYAGESVDERLQHDEAGGVSFFEVDGARLEVPFDAERMFGVQLCRYLALEDGAWVQASPPALLELWEGIDSPWCARPDEAPRLQALLQPGMNETFTQHLSDLLPVPSALRELPLGADTTWQLIDPLDLAVGMEWFEGSRLQEPVVAEVDGRWQVLEGFGAAREWARPVKLYARGQHVLVCTDGEAHLYDRGAGYARVWTGQGQCPTFLPLD